jgi:hypothetical protein
MAKQATEITASPKESNKSPELCRRFIMPLES